MIWWVICENWLTIGFRNAFFSLNTWLRTIYCLQTILWENLVGKSCWKILSEILVGNSCIKILWENLSGKSCGKFLWENLAGNSCGKLLQKFLRENLVGNSCGKILQKILLGYAVGNLLGNLVETVLMVCNGSKNGKNHQHRQFLHLWEIFKPITTTKTLSNYFHLVEKVLSFDLVGHM